MSSSQLENLIPQRKLADMLSVSPQTLWRWTKHGLNGRKLESVRFGRRVFYTPDAVEAFKTTTSGDSHARSIQ